MLDILESDYGSFDLVTALCTLYYLSEDEMAKVVTHVSHLSPKIVIQAVEGKVGAQTDPDKPRRASAEFLGQLLRNNGFSQVSVYEPQTFDPRGTKRPILVGRRS